MQDVGLRTHLLNLALILLPLILRATEFKEERNLAVDHSVGIGTSRKNHLTAHYNYVSLSQIVKTTGVSILGPIQRTLAVHELLLPRMFSLVGNVGFRKNLLLSDFLKMGIFSIVHG